MLSRIKSHLHRSLLRRGFDIVRDPFPRRLVRVLSDLSVSTVLDVGANAGQFAIGLRDAGYRGDIVSVEPLLEAFAQLEAAAVRDNTWSTERIALAASPGQLILNRAANSVSSSVLAMLPAHERAASASRYVGTEAVPAETVDRLIARRRLDPARTLLKLDVQGYENSVLTGASHSIDRFAAVLVELSFQPVYEGSWLFDEMRDYLGKHGYELWMLDPATFYDPISCRLLQGDGLFVRTAITSTSDAARTGQA